MRGDPADEQLTMSSTGDSERMPVVAKFQVRAVGPQTGGASVFLWPVNHENDPDHPNRKFWEATPSGRIEMFITNPGAADYFEMDAVYTVTFDRETVAPADEASSVATAGVNANP